MAGDLIPPPSPGGRPSPDRSEETDGHQLGRIGPEKPAPEPEEPPQPVVAAGPPVETPYRSRFGFVLGALIGVGLAAATIAGALLVSGGSDSQKAGWSTWRPSADEGFAAAKQIASHVGKRYRLGDGSQLVAITSGPLEIQTLPLEIAVRTAPTGGNIELVEGKGVLYTLNGLGPQGSILKGKPSAERLLVLRREALELALYTFRYVDDVDMVVTLLPPAPPKKESAKDAASSSSTSDTEEHPVTALLFRPGDLESQLDVPLNATLARSAPRPETLREPEAGLIDRLTRPNFFKASFQPSQDARVFLVLDRIPK